MARIASQSKGGYYATPIKEMQLLCRHLRQECSDEVEDSFLNMLDPCCGEGEALALLADALKDANPISYGVELEHGRASAASTALDHVIQDGYENLRTESKFSLLWLNPPYDELFGERLEVTFLRALTGRRNVLEKDGILLFCVPQYVLKSAAGIISGRFRDVRVYRFTDEHYPIYKQVVLIGRLGKSDKSKEIYKWLKEIGDLGPEALPTLEEMDEDIIVRPSMARIDVFRAGRLRLDELKKDFMASPLFHEVENKIAPLSNRASMKNPMLPLKPTHTGIAIASGAVGGNMGTHIISGITKQITDVEDRVDNEGLKNGELVTKHFRSVVRVFWPHGVHDLE